MRAFPRITLMPDARRLVFGESIPELLAGTSTPASSAWLCEDGKGVEICGGGQSAARCGTLLPISYKEASPQALATAPPLAADSTPPPVRLAVAVLAECKIRGEEGLLISRRLRFVKDQPTWNGLWVFPGGGVHQFETLEQACKREFEEETGLPLAADSLNRLALWQAGVPAQHKQYLIVIFSGRVDEAAMQAKLSEATDASIIETALQMQATEVGAIAFLPRDQLHLFTESWRTGPEEQQVQQDKQDEHALLQHQQCKKQKQKQDEKSEASHTPVFSGWELCTESLEESDSVARAAQFKLDELEGDGGEKSGIGGGHRFGIRNYLQHLDCESDNGNSSKSKI